MDNEKNEDYGPFTPIPLSEIPDGVTPILCNSLEEAKEVLNTILEKRASENELFCHLGEVPVLEKFPLIKTKAESHTELNPDYWWHCHLDVYFTYPYIGGPITVHSTMGGFTFTVGWEQTAGTSAKWNGNQIEYTITGNELYYIVVEGIGQVYSNPVTFSGTYNVH